MRRSDVIKSKLVTWITVSCYERLFLNGSISWQFCTQIDTSTWGWVRQWFAEERINGVSWFRRIKTETPLLSPEMVTWQQSCHGIWTNVQISKSNIHHLDCNSPIWTKFFSACGGIKTYLRSTQSQDRRSPHSCHYKRPSSHSSRKPQLLRSRYSEFYICQSKSGIPLQTTEIYQVRILDLISLFGSNGCEWSHSCSFCCCCYCYLQ
jgi:hypothetical protein